MSHQTGVTETLMGIDYDLNLYPRLAGFALGLAAAAPTAIALIMVRSLHRSESPGAIAFFFAVASMVGGLCPHRNDACVSLRGGKPAFAF